MSTLQSTIAITEEVIASLAEARVLFDPPASSATRGEFVSFDDSSLHSSIANSLKKDFPNGLFTHQHQAIENSLGGRHTVTATRTSSGKSLTFALPALHAMCSDADSTALFLYPQKALANDQLGKLAKLTSAIPLLATRLRSNPDLVSRYDGSTKQADRAVIRENAQLLITNPDMLHIGILQHHSGNWARFFSNLKLVAIDECHDYRGSFGANVSMVLRRLRQVCRLHGADPVFTASSATIADPKFHLHQLTGLDFELVGPQMDRSRQGRRKIWVVGSDTHHHDLGRKMAAKLTKAGLRVLVFCPSRVAAEKMVDRMRSSDGIPQQQIAVYRAGLSATERAEVEQGLQDGSKRLVFSTNALELGIDIGHLDVAICIGLPATMMSLWQRAGRVARAGREGAIVLIPGSSPIDNYYAHRPAELLARDNETIAINIDNEKIVCQHYACAIDEHGNDEAAMDAEVLGPMAVKIREQRKRGESYGANDFICNDPHGAVRSLRNGGNEDYKLICDGVEVGEIGMFHLLRETPRNAIYRHGGRTYRVQSINKDDRTVRLIRERTRNETIPFTRKKLKLQSLKKRSVFEGLEIAVGRLEITEYLESLTEKEPNGAVRQVWPRPAGMPSHRLRTEGTLVILRSEIIQKLRRQLNGTVDLSAHSAERLLLGMFPTVAGPCDPQDFSSGTLTTGEGDPAIVLYDTSSGGIGLTEAAYRTPGKLVANAIDCLQACKCEADQGCIRCVANPHQETQASKSAALALLRFMHHALLAAPTRTWSSDLEESAPLFAASPTACPGCKTQVPSESRFCLNCGTRLEALNG